MPRNIGASEEEVANLHKFAVTMLTEALTGKRILSKEDDIALKHTTTILKQSNIEVALPKGRIGGLSISEPLPFPSTEDDPEDSAESEDIAAEG